MKTAKPDGTVHVHSYVTKRMIGYFKKSKFDLHDTISTFDSFDEFDRLIGVNIGSERAYSAVIFASAVLVDMTPEHMRNGLLV